MSSPADPRCARTNLAVTESCLVQRCSCGHIHLSIGPITLRLPPEAIAGLARGLQIATQTLEGLPSNPTTAHPSELN